MRDTDRLDVLLTRLRLNLGWLCTVCGRNTLRSFATDGLAFVDLADPPPPPAG